MIKPLRFLSGVSDDIRNSRTDVIQKTIGMCNENKFDCDALDLPEDAFLVTGSLPAVTRCWSTYVTFYGDNQPLSCTNADTCKVSAMGQDLVPCITCPESTPPNPLVLRF